MERNKISDPMNKDYGPEAILKIARQFMESRILLTAAEMNLFTLLADIPLTARDLASKLDADPRGSTILLDALAAIGLLSKQEDRYLSAPDAIRFLTDKSPDSVLPMALHAASLWKSWSNLTSLIRGTGLKKNLVHIARNTDELRSFIGAMHAVGKPLAKGIVTAIQPGSAKHLLDVGGASGTYTIAFLKAAPEMKATIFDLPSVIQITRERMTEEGLDDRVRFAAGDFYVDELPGGHDIALLSAIIHQNNPANNIELFRKVFRSLDQGGRIIIRDHVMAQDRTEPKEGAIFAVNMLVNTTGGSTYTFEEIRDWLEKAGFVKIRLLQAGKRMDALVEAFKP